MDTGTLDILRSFVGDSSVEIDSSSPRHAVLRGAVGMHVLEICFEVLDFVMIIFFTNQIKSGISQLRSMLNVLSQAQEHCAVLPLLDLLPVATHQLHAATSKTGLPRSI